MYACVIMHVVVHGLVVVLTLPVFVIVITSSVACVFVRVPLQSYEGRGSDSHVHKGFIGAVEGFQQPGSGRQEGVRAHVTHTHTMHITHTRKTHT